MLVSLIDVFVDSHILGMIKLVTVSLAGIVCV